MIEIRDLRKVYVMGEEALAAPWDCSIFNVPE